MTYRTAIGVIICIFGTFLVGCAAGGGDDAECGDGLCEAGEDRLTCPQDCTAECGNQQCEAGETAQSCATDCYCGNGSCDPGEDPTSCAQDCVTAECGNGICESAAGETEASCPQDCSSSGCGDGTCSTTETTDSCPSDCYCGNGTCDYGEDENNCSDDCGSAATCGDGTCDPGETATNCPADCGTCGNGVCDSGENSTNCPEDCTGCTDPICDLYPQCGCNSGQKCTISGGARACMAAGTSQHGQICTGETDCAEGTACINTGATDAFCLQFCNTDADCTAQNGSRSKCLIELDDGTGSSIPGVKLCTIDCDPASSVSSCPSGYGCQLFYIDENEDSNPDEWFTDCADAGSVGTGGTCDGTSSLCTQGNMCYTTDSECLQYCVYPGGSCTMTGYSCVQLDPSYPAIVGANEYGVCY